MKIHLIKIKIKVSTHSRPKAAGARVGLQCFQSSVSTHSRPKAAGARVGLQCFQSSVSTHSRPKAAGTVFKIFAFCEHGFNTQPPEGGWCLAEACIILLPFGFNTQPPEGGWH